MGSITSLFVHKVVNAATAGDPSGPSRRRALLQSVDIDPDAPVDPKRMIDDADYYRLCEQVAREDPGGSSISMRVGGSMRCDDYGAFGLAFKTAVDLRGSYSRTERYARVLTSVSTYELRSEGGRYYMLLHRDGERHLGLRLSNEQTIAAVTAISREVSSRPFSPEAVYFKHPAPDDISAHEEYFGCRVHFDADRDALLVTKESLDVPNRLGDSSVSSFFDAHLKQEVSEVTQSETLDRRVRDRVSKVLSEGVPTVSDVAAALGVSGRTLQRRLADEGYAYQQIVDVARRELAEKLLRRSDYSLAEIAFLTGFSEQSAFNRAFKRWAGQTPRSFRLDASPRH